VVAYYLDSSGLAKRYARETGTVWVTNITDPKAGNELFISLITGAEVVAAIARWQRTGLISTADATQVIRAFRWHFQSQYTVIVVTRDMVDRAMELAELHALRGYDSVQLATALALQGERATLGLSPLMFVSADKDLNMAATQEGLAVENPNDYAHPNDLSTP
jgi:hypothetical protein